ncbi:hypothetical protein ABW19_dt0203382 [Dactylella cylindrospora]|nr:hypothetical protein ABW19_dt0203382 [Dactylella cylindrospora]
MSKLLRAGSVRLQSNIARANSGKEGRQLAEIDYGEDQGVGLGSDWMVSAPDERNEGTHNWRPFCVDIYFWKHSMADYFVRVVDEYQKRVQTQQAEANRKASIPEAAPSPSTTTPTQNGEAKPQTPEPRVDTRAIEDEDDEEMFKKNITSVDCLDCNNGEIFPAPGSVMECKVIKNQTKKTTKILVSAAIEGGHVKLIYTLTERSFPYQLPESTVQVRFMLVEKIISVNPGANLDIIKTAAPLDSPIFQFEQDEHAQIFLECLRGEQLLFNGIVDWVRSTREPKEGEPTASGPHPANFTCVDDRRIQLWENELGYINVVFHRQFHLVSAFIAPTTQVEAEAGASTLKISGIKIRKLEKSPNIDAKEPWKSEGNPAVLKLRFAGPEHVASFRESVLKHRDATAMLYPEVSKTIAQTTAQETPDNKVPPPPPPEFRHGRSMSTSAAMPPPPGPPPSSPPQQYPTSPQSPGAHQTAFPQYSLGHTQSVRMNRPPPLPMFPNQQPTYVPGGMQSPRFQGAQPSPMTGTFAPANLGQFQMPNYGSPPGANPGAVPYQSPAAIANAAVPPISPMPNQSYFPTTITPMTPGLPTGKFPPPLQTSLPQPPGSQPPPTPIREHMRKNSYPPNHSNGPESTHQEPVELPASFPDPPEPKSAEVKEQPTPAPRKFTKEDDIPEEEPAGYNPLGGNVSIGAIPPLPGHGKVQQVEGGGGKMSRVWKKLK